MKLVKSLLEKCVCLALGVFLAALGLYLFKALSGPSLRPWHTWKPASEFHFHTDSITDLQGYLTLENDLFNELDAFQRKVKASRISRYSPNYRLAFPVDRFDWNRSVELKSASASGAVLMLHGMSDSPYSLRSLSYTFRRQGYHVLVLRLPGHGTAPSSLTRGSWEDMAKAVRLAILHLRKSLSPGRPLYLVGYSNGAALALEYALNSLENDQLPRPAGMILISPALTVTPAARFSRLIIAASHLPGLQKLAWLSRLPEYDPYKYNSFAINAGYQVYRLAEQVQKNLGTLRQKRKMADFPPVLAIQSVVDTTVSSRAVVDQLMAHLHSGRDELILFDVNRDADIVSLFARNDQEELASFMQEPTNYGLTLVTNRNPESPEVWEKRRPIGQGMITATPLQLQWPVGVYSLSHVALPIPPDDPVYGVGTEDKPTLGRVELRGEQRLLLVPADQLMRLRYNPFYNYMEKRILEFARRTADASRTQP